MFTPIPLNLPAYAAKIQQNGTKLYIFDELRRKQLVLTPEEWVRQHWVHHLIRAKRCPKALIKLEGGLKVNTMPRRSDLVVFDTGGNKILLAEFKAPSVKITQAAFEQIARYNSVPRIPLLLVSNGLQHYYCRIDIERHSFEFLSDLPDFDTPFST